MEYITHLTVQCIQFNHTLNRGHRRALLHPLKQTFDCRAGTAGNNFDAAIRQVPGMSAEAEAQRFATRAVTIENALYAAGNRKSATRRSSLGVHVAYEIGRFLIRIGDQPGECKKRFRLIVFLIVFFIDNRQCLQRAALRLQRLPACLRIVFPIQSILCIIQMSFRFLNLNSGHFIGACLSCSRYRLPGIAHLLNRWAGLACKKACQQEKRQASQS